jgi:hypothetical protein
MRITKLRYLQEGHVATTAQQGDQVWSFCFSDFRFVHSTIELNLASLDHAAYLIVQTD